MVRTSLFERGFSGRPRSAVDLSDRAFRDCGFIKVDSRTAVVLDGRHNGCGGVGHDLRNNACERVIGRFNVVVPRSAPPPLAAAAAAL